MSFKREKRHGHIRTLRPELVIEMDGGTWTTSAKDPGSTCPKCGRDLVWQDETLFCDGGFMGSNNCDFQYTLSEEELEREEKKMLAFEDEKARKETLERVQKNGPPVFGQADPRSYRLPSYEAELEKSQWRHYLS